MADNETLEALLDGVEMAVPVPGTHDAVLISRLEHSGTTYHVWVNGNNQESPDFVVVNPPSEIINSAGEPEEDKLGAVVQAIYGVMH